MYPCTSKVLRHSGKFSDIMKRFLEKKNFLQSLECFQLYQQVVFGNFPIIPYYPIILEMFDTLYAILKYYEPIKKLNLVHLVNI